MRTFQVPVGPNGPLVEIAVHFSGLFAHVLRQAGKPIPAPVSALALIDTGADTNCVVPDLLKPLQQEGLQPARILPVNIPALGGLGAAAEYSVSLTILHPSGNPKANLVLRNQAVIERRLGTLGYQALIGRDVLEHCLLVYDGPGRSVTLAY